MIKRACKYFIRVRKGYIYCECARLGFENLDLRKSYCNKFCNQPEGNNLCPIKNALDAFYDG
jgi:hypothetical protein